MIESIVTKLFFLKPSDNKKIYFSLSGRAIREINNAETSLELSFWDNGEKLFKENVNLEETLPGKKLMKTIQEISGIWLENFDDEFLLNKYDNCLVFERQTVTVYNAYLKRFE